MRTQLAPSCTLLLVAALASTPPAQTPIVEANGAQVGNAFGRAVGGGGDIDGDGFDDIVVGAPFANFSTGRVVVISGFDGSVLHDVAGDAIGDQLGFSVATGGDVNGDGFDDFAAGANTASINTGYLRVFSGLDGSVLYDFTGAAINDFYGWAVDLPGDIDRDGREDILVGAPQPGAGPGYYELRSGRDGSLLLTFANGPTVNFGLSVSGAGDVNADGVLDILIGDPGAFNFGNARVLSGVDGSVIHTLADGVGVNFGFSVAGLGDVDGDGFDDVACSVNHTVGTGTVRVFSGATGLELYSVNGDFTGDRFGQAIAGGGDLDGDGNGDLVVGAPQSGPMGVGYARGYSGIDGSILFTIEGSATNSLFGNTIAMARNVDHDGFADIVVGSPGASNATGSAGVYGLTAYDTHVDGGTEAPAPAGGEFGRVVVTLGDLDNDQVSDYAVGAPNNSSKTFTNNGSVWVYSGADNSLLFTFDGAATGDRLGNAISSADVDNDSVPDIIIGSFQESSIAVRAGMVQVFSGANGTLIYTMTGTTAEDRLGAAVAGLGDLNADNHEDFAIGAQREGAGDEGTVRIHSGIDGSILFTLNGIVPGEGFGSSIAAIDDLDGDGTTDYIVGSPQTLPAPTGAGIARVFSGATSAELFAVGGDAFSDAFGRNVVATGDVNRDGTPDFAVSAHLGNPGGINNAGYVRVFSGVDASQIHNVDGLLAGDNLGLGLAGPGDLNGDGFTDFVVGVPGRNGATGSAFALSGRDASTLFSFAGGTPGDQYGFAVGALSDVNGDGLGDFAVGAPFQGTAGIQAGQVQRIVSDLCGSPGLVIDYGAGCDSAIDTLPRISVEGVPALAETFSIRLDSATPSATVFFMAGLSGSELSIDLTPFGMPDCTQLVNPTLTPGSATDGLGRTSLAINVPNLPSLVGVSFNGQWAIVDAAANGWGLVFSDALTVTIGEESK